MQYEKEKLANAKDFNLTCEYLDGWQVRYIIVSAKVRNIFGEHQFPFGHFSPVALL